MSGLDLTLVMKVYINYSVERLVFLSFLCAEFPHMQFSNIARTLI